MSASRARCQLARVRLLDAARVLRLLDVERSRVDPLDDPAARGPWSWRSTSSRSTA